MGGESRTVSGCDRVARAFRHGNVPRVTVRSGTPNGRVRPPGRSRQPYGAVVLPSGAMATVPLDEGYPGRRRVGPFWIEEGVGLVVAGAVLLVAVIALYIVAVADRPH